MGKLFGYLLLLVMGLSSCALVDKAAIKTTANIMQKGSDQLLYEPDWYFFKESAPGNLKLIEGMWFADQKNKQLLGLLVKGYSAYTFAVLETQAIRDQILGNSETLIRQRVLMNYEKAIEYGFKYLELMGISREDFLNKSFPQTLEKTFLAKASDEDYVTLFYFAQAMGSSLNNQRQNMDKLAYLNHVKLLMQWVCSVKPDIEYGNCKLFDAILEATTPRVLGGNMAKAQKKFKEAIKLRPENLLIRLSYIQYYLIPLLEEEEFSVEMERLRKDLGYWYSSVQGIKNREKLKYDKTKIYNLFNSVARQKYRKLLKLRKEIF
ncbi:MAG: TRAP transporter TatT component family protein [Bacteriovoracaceae bacterium]|nr:TRAP transporter TatT component family protein [Bacteriovoracaceae bacterium]